MLERRSKLLKLSLFIWTKRKGRQLDPHCMITITSKNKDETPLVKYIYIYACVWMKLKFWIDMNWGVQKAGNGDSFGVLYKMAKIFSFSHLIINQDFLSKAPSKIKLKLCEMTKLLPQTKAGKSYPMNFRTLPFSSLIGEMVRRFQKGVPSFL